MIQKDRPLKIGVVGVGRLGELHAKKLSLMPEALLVGVQDENFERAKAVAKETKTETYKDLKSFLSKLEAVVIAATTQSHFKLCSQALEAGLHVFVEKPLAPEAKQAKILSQEAKKKELLLQVGHIERFNPAFLETLRFLENPRFIETIRIAPFQPRGTDVSVVLDLMIHDLDLILSLQPGVPEKVEAFGESIFSSHIDLVNARINFSNGAVANLTASRVSNKTERKIRIFQPTSLLSVDLLKPTCKVYKVTPNVALEKKPDFKQITPEKGDPLKAELSAFVHSVQNASSVLVSGEQALQSIELAERISSNIQENKEKWLSSERPSSLL